MRETLYIRLRSASPEALTRYCIAGSGAALSWPVSEAPLQDVLAQAQTATQTRRIILLVPGADVRLTSVNVPARSAAKVLLAAPYALEEQLAEDVDVLHFALGPRQADGAHPVAVVSRARMDEWLAPLLERGLQPEALIPETLSLPETAAGVWSVLAENDHITVRTGDYSGFGCLPEDLPLFLQLSGAAAETLLRITVPRDFSGDFTQLGQPVELLPGFSSGFEALLQNLRPERAINLLQGAYSQREGVKRLWLPWRNAAALAAIWLLLAGVNHGVQAYKLGKELIAQDDSNQQRFRQVFPSEQRIVDLSAQAEQQMTLLQGSARKGGFLPLLETLSASLTATPGLSLQSLQFREGSLFVGLGGNDLQQLEVLRSWFAQNHGAVMEVQSANSGADGVQIRLKLTPA